MMFRCLQLSVLTDVSLLALETSLIHWYVSMLVSEEHFSRELSSVLVTRLLDGTAGLDCSVHSAKGQKIGVGAAPQSWTQAPQGSTYSLLLLQGWSLYYSLVHLPSDSLTVLSLERK